MKILITSDWNPYSVNGVATSISNLRDGLVALGHDVQILTLSETVHTIQNENTYYIKSISLGAVYPGARISLPRNSKVIKEIVEWGPDIIHSNCEFSTFRMAKAIKRKLDIPLVHTYHTLYENYTHYLPVKRFGSLFVKTITKQVGRKSDVMIAPSKKMADILDENYGLSVPIVVVPSGIKLERFAHSLSENEKLALRKTYRIPEKNKILLYLGRIAKEKNVEEIMDYFNEYNPKNATLLIVGGGPYLGNIINHKNTHYPRANIVFAGAVKPKEAWKFYRLSDLFVSASQSETQGLTYIEALASGLPLLCKKDDCLDGIVKNGIDGWQYETKDEFNQFLSEFLASEESQKSLKENASKYSEAYSVPNFAKNMEELYINLINEYNS